MTGTTVSAMRQLTDSFTNSKSTPIGNGGNSGFRAVWDSQTFGGQSGSNDNSKTISAQTASQRTEAPTARDSLNRQQDKVVSGEQDINSEETEETKATDESALEAIMTLLAAADNFAEQVAQELGISPEELDGMLQELGMKRTDLLSQDGLMKLVLKSGGADDTMALLTNEELYHDLQKLTGNMEELLKQISQETGLSQKELTGILEQASSLAEGTLPEEQTPMITVDEEPSEGYRKPEDTEGLKPEQQDNSIQETDKVHQKESGNHHQNADSGENNSNLFSQNLAQRLEQANAAGAAGETAAFSAPDTQSIMKQLMDYMKIQMKPDMTNLEMQLHPENLGTLHIQLTAKEGAVTAQFVTQNETVKAALESQMIQLKENFDEQGVKVDAIEVLVQSHEFDRNLDQGGRGGQEEASSRRNKSRRINLNLPSEMEVLTTEEQITADLMAANGNTVDYTA